MDWKILEIKESLENKIKICENFMELCDSQIKNYKSRFETNSVNQAANYEYWKTCKVRTAYEIKDLQELLQEIDDMMKEEVRDFESAEEDMRINISNAQIHA